MKKSELLKYLEKIPDDSVIDIGISNDESIPRLKLQVDFDRFEIGERCVHEKGSQYKLETSKGTYVCNDTKSIPRLEIIIKIRNRPYPTAFDL